MGRGLGHLAAHRKSFIKNGSKIKILKIPQILMKISKYSILDHIYMALIYLMRPWTLTNAENFKTSRSNYTSKISKKDLIQHIYVKSVYSTPQY